MHDSKWDSVETQWASLVKLHKQLRDHRVALSSTHSQQTQDQNGDLSHLKERAQRLKAEVEVLKNAKSPVLDEDTDVSIAKAKLELKKSMQSGELAVQLAKDELANVTAELEREKQQKYNHERMLEALDAKLEQVKNEMDLDQTPRMSLTDRANEISKKNQRLQREMGQFMETHFPNPTSQDTATPDAQYSSFMDLLEDLMNRVTFHPEDPYIAIESNLHWPPYIEFLVRWGIGLKHPTKSDLIKLTEYHI